MTTIDDPTTSTATPSTAAAEAYVAAVAAALVAAGVADPERQELLDDLVGHLAELEAEDGESLEAQLGPPATYAAELLASAGIDVGAGSAPDAPSVPLWRSSVDAVRAGFDGPRAKAVRAFLPELRPGWWVLRGWAFVAMLTAWVPDDHQIFPLPDLLGNGFLSFLALIGAVVASVRIGRRRGRLDQLATGVGVVAILVALMVGGPRTEYVSYDDGYYPRGLLVAPDGRTITNIWPFDAEGRPLEGVLLFDQDGRPVDVGELSEFGDASFVIPGLFPQAQRIWEYDPTTGVEREVPAPPPSVSIPRLPGAGPSSTTSTTAPPDPAATTTTAPPPPADPGATTTVAAPSS